MDSSPITRFILTLSLALLGVLGASPFASATALDGKEIMEKSEAATLIPQFTAKAVLRSAKKSGEAKEKAFFFWRKLKDDGVRYRSLTRFTAPSEVKGEAILFLENEHGANDILLYLPAYQKTRRIERTQQSSSFMGSDFSYSDLTKPHTSDYKYVLAGEEKCPEESAATCYRIAGEPATPLIRDQTGYSKMTIWIRKENFLMVHTDDYDLEGALIKKAILSDPEKLPGGKYFQKKIAVTNQKDGGQTSLQFSELKTEEKIPDSVFTQQSLGKGSK